MSHDSTNGGTKTEKAGRETHHVMQGHVLRFCISVQRLKHNLEVIFQSMRFLLYHLNYRFVRDVPILLRSS